MDRNDYMIVPLLAAFEWFDESLQRSLKEAGWPPLTRPESMVMMHVQLNIVRPSDIARSLRLTRQAIHATIGSLVERNLNRWTIGFAIAFAINTVILIKKPW